MGLYTGEGWCRTDTTFVKEHVLFVTVLTANLPLILTVRTNIVWSDEITSGEASVGVQVPVRQETSFHNTIF